MKWDIWTLALQDGGAPVHQQQEGHHRHKQQRGQGVDGGVDAKPGHGIDEDGEVLHLGGGEKGDNEVIQREGEAEVRPDTTRAGSPAGGSSPSLPGRRPQVQGGLVAWAFICLSFGSTEKRT